MLLFPLLVQFFTYCFNKDQRVFLGNDPININEIGAKLKQKIRDPQHQSIFVRADENVPFGAFATVMDAVKHPASPT